MLPCSLYHYVICIVWLVALMTAKSEVISLLDSLTSIFRIMNSPQIPYKDKIDSVELIRIERSRQWKDYYKSKFNNFITHQHTSNTITLYPKRNGIAAVSSIINDNKKIIMCTIPKIDSTTWRKVMLYLEHPEYYNSRDKSIRYSPPDQHNIKKNGVKLMAHQQPDVANKYYSNPSYLKVMHCRNPVVRILSAWLSKNANSTNPIPFAADHATFHDFIMVCK